MSQGAPFRPMKYPYTVSAKIAQFPYKYYIKHSWLFRYMLVATVVTMPFFYKVEKLSYAPENVAKWEKTHREMFEGTGHH
ncbi:PREDICTED: uncharacterized protein LOC105563004 [Vollenhovia emeryi]|uniref:uncharacterized protein LOC105563004 n=1 Tax=Vollenhovia emeryi TaxID=411798 RepID=UPI0005F3B87E|nr:PREDICTED: uncharacterized protein LOC105563004 [Vollenhovia emeryi]